MINRRVMLKGAAASALASSAIAQEGTGPFDRPTVRFNKAAQDRLPNWAFSQPLNIPLTPRPTAIGEYRDLVAPGAKPFGESDPTAIGASYHGVAQEWGMTPDHWKEFGCDTTLTGVDAWKNKQERFGVVKRHDDPAKTMRNWGEFPVKCYKIPIQETQIKLREDVAFPARMYSFAGMVPGPSLKMRLGQPVVVRFENHLDTEISVHLHGGHNPSHSDGFPSFYALQGKSRDYFYPNFIPLKADKPGTARPSAGGSLPPPRTVDVGEAQSTMWYHDHAMDATAYNVSKGLAAFAPCFGETELGLIRSGVLPGLRERSCCDPEQDCLATDPQKIAELEHPDHPGFYRRDKEPYANPYDIPIVIQDKVIDRETGQIAYDSDGHNGYLGDTFLLNGVAWPYHEVGKRKHRLRFLNGSNARVYRLRILSEADFHRLHGGGIDGADEDAADRRPDRYDEIAKPFLQIGKDSWLWSRAVEKRSVVIAMANRADLVVDFKQLASHLQANEEACFYLVNTMPQFDGRGPKVRLDDGGDPRVLPLPFDTVRDPNDAFPPARVPELNRPIPLMKFVVTGTPAPYDQDASVKAGTTLNPHDPIEDDEIVAVREFIFERGKGAWQINGRFYDPTIANAAPTLGTAEEWVLRNGGGGWWHPIHIHLESHQLVKYEKDFEADRIVDPGDPPALTQLTRLRDVTSQIEPTELRGLHDTQILGPNTVARIRMRFRTWSGPFVFHCHNLEHEDMRMMFNFEPVPRSDHATAARDANIIPSSRTHGDSITLQPSGIARRVGELPWESPPVPQTKTSEAGENLIPERKPGAP